MSMWIYQLNQENWSPEIFRYEIWEQQRWSWPYGKKVGDDNPAPGDTLVFFYAPRGGNEPGIYGWAVIERWDGESKTVYFIPATPTDYLKMDPWWDEDAKKILNEIRGRMKQATLFLVPKDKVFAIRHGIKKSLHFA